jgi:hypothetical protein
MAGASNPLKPLTSTFSINNVPGWNTRHIYNYYGTPSGVLDYVSSSLDFTSDLFQIIKNYNDPIGNNSQPVAKGAINTNKNFFPNRYFATGKTLRIKGRFLISTPSSGTPIFNMAISANNSISGSTLIASTNNGHNHESTISETNMPVDFEITLTSIENQFTITTPYNALFMQANGHYQYEYANYNSAGRNISVAYVPIWNDLQYVQVGLLEDASTNAITLDFTNSDKIDSIKVMYITIEELE